MAEQTKSQTTDDVDEFQILPSEKDGETLHQEVPPDMWCVTRRDLKHFRLVVSRAIREGSLVPTEADPFDPKDHRIGPRMPTVCEQVIKPMTLKAGGMSWALMRHPNGVKCDLFVTHGWSEGVYEFIDKVLHCWPAGAEHAYCCMLSNPQNLNISSLLDNPQWSPFAAALNSAKYMLVVPNKSSSIYTRIWCIYEAYLAYSWGKFIYTAWAPIHDMQRRMLVMAFIDIVCLLLGVLKANLFTFLLEPYIFLCVLFCCIGGALLPSLLVSNPLLQGVLNHVAGAIFSVLAGISVELVIEDTLHDGIFEVVPPGAWMSFFVSTAIAMCALEADRLWAAEAKEEAACLSAGYTGKVSDAKATQLRDRECILGEIAASGKVKEVEHAVSVLISAGMSTPTLRAAAALGANVQNAGKWSLGMVVWVLIAWIQHPATHVFYDSSCGGVFRVVPYIKVAQGLAWVTFFICAGPDKKGFAANAGGKLAVAPYLALWSAWTGSIAASGSCCMRLHCVPDAIGAFVLGPLMLAVSLAGAARIACIPRIGPQVVQWTLAVPQTRRLAAAMRQGNSQTTLSRDMHDKC